MLIFETVLALLLGAALLSLLARRINVPYPTLLALGGILVAFLPSLPRLELPPDLILVIFVAPVLLDASHDASWRDLRKNWLPVLSLVLFAVGLTTIAVSFAVRFFFPDMPWGAAIALGALLAPPDAVAALAVLSQVEPPHRLRTILEGESLLNDASSLLIYKLALGAVAAHSFGVRDAIPAFVIVTFGSAAVGWGLAKVVGKLTSSIDDAPTAIIIQFVTTFGVWLLAEHFELSGVVTIVVFGLTAGQRNSQAMTAHIRIPSFATWESATFVLNVFAFTLIGLQIKPILGGLQGTDLRHQLLVALVILVVVVVVRLAWVLMYGLAKWLARQVKHQGQDNPLGLTVKSGVMIGWSGMRGIVTLAAALAIPDDFPYRNFILLTAFTVVLGTLLIQGLTLRPLLLWLRLPPDDTVESEIALARKAALKAAMSQLEQDHSPAAERLKLQYQEALRQTRDGGDPRNSPDNVLRQSALPSSRQAIQELRSTGRIGDDAYRTVEQELDWLELSTSPEENSD
ncbi:sodium, potassium, lithium and rubidium/H(+) antiporter [Abditibacteriota bacterium]|nr:sodium, potassium, lithium and rubidium/H(+) antiporter [Abditibacteriota bacterium]